MIEKEVGLPIAHETHRRRLFWNPFNFRDVLKVCITGSSKSYSLLLEFEVFLYFEDRFDYEDRLTGCPGKSAFVISAKPCGRVNVTCQ